MADKVKTEVEETKVETEAQNQLKKKAIIAGRIGLGLGVLGLGTFIAYQIGHGRGNDEAMTEIYKKFPEFRDKLSELDPAFFAAIKL